MVLTLLYLLFKKLRKYDWSKIKMRSIFFPVFMRSNQIIFTLVVIMLLLSIVLTAQKQVRNYKVMRKGSEIGWMHVDKQTDSNITTITMDTEVRIKFLLTFSTAAKEISQFRDGKLQHSYYYRKTNGDIKADRHTNLAGSNYEVADNEKTRLNISPVTYNTLCMYFQEPVNLSKVYSDNHQCFLDIEKGTDGGYKIVSPDDSINTFYYTGGICYKVKINHSFYSAELMLK